MRLPRIEKRLLPVLRQYIKKVYPLVKAKAPELMVMSYEQFSLFEFLPPGTHGYYSVTGNVIVIPHETDLPLSFRITHEIAHWEQAARVGGARFLEECKVSEADLRYENEANEAGHRNYSIWARLVAEYYPPEAEE